MKPSVYLDNPLSFTIEQLCYFILRTQFSERYFLYSVQMNANRWLMQVFAHRGNTWYDPWEHNEEQRRQYWCELQPEKISIRFPNKNHFVPFNVGEERELASILWMNKMLDDFNVSVLRAILGGI